ncbi:OmpA/MotB family protein [Anaeromyxobacter oryzae]|uniref:OmpA-like domain-containing protein n=1 Tax=Anaeromyxobacter oryzae TaxID=2918170 RepID=A0ABM7X1E7_9BACT|nr:OmpA family protein [Anaeromyxobacter oryzae]BDG05617.1 hypothetical protein AMOR_46130 [Anaeromyxobacter oryzae]
MQVQIKVGVVLFLVGAAGCVTSGKYEKKAKESAANETRAKACEEQVAALTASNESLQRDLTAATQAHQELKVQAAAAEAKSAQYEQLAGSLQRQIRAGQIEISELRGKMIVKLKDKILFSSGSAKLSEEGRAALGVVADVFKDMKGKNVVVAGFTDDIPVASGQYRDNWELSTARAVAVVRYLTSRGVPPHMLGAAGFSEFRPIVANDTPANRSQNRRIEIALTPADYEAPVVEPR